MRCLEAQTETAGGDLKADDRLKMAKAPMTQEGSWVQGVDLFPPHKNLISRRSIRRPWPPGRRQLQQLSAPIAGQARASRGRGGGSGNLLVQFVASPSRKSTAS